MQQIGKAITEMNQLKNQTGEEKKKIRKQIEEEYKHLALQTIRKYEQQKNDKIKRLFEENSLINKDLQKATFDNYTSKNEELQKALKVAKRYVETFDKEEPRNLLLYGNYGTGKSHLSVGIIKELIKKEITSIFISMPKLHTKLKNSYDKKSETREEEIMKALEGIELLVLDDIGSEHDTEWANSKLFEILDSRQGKHNIFTTNLNEDELKKHVGDRNYSRLMYNTHLIKMTGKDYRLRK